MIWLFTLIIRAVFCPRGVNVMFAALCFAALVLDWDETVVLGGSALLYILLAAIG